MEHKRNGVITLDNKLENNKVDNNNDTNNKKTKEECNPYLAELKDSDFKDFYINNKKARKYLLSKIPGKYLSKFAAKEFLIADILKCIYINRYLKKRDITRKNFIKNSKTNIIL